MRSALELEHEDRDTGEGFGASGELTSPVGWEDVLTGLPGPAFWHKVLDTESARNRRYGGQATVVLVEIRGLTEVKELWGADMAEQVVAAVARILRRGSRGSDYLARLEVGRLALILTETDEIAAVNFVERVREDCAHQLRGTPEVVHVAFGWASPRSPATLLEVVEQAEQRLDVDRRD